MSYLSLSDLKVYLGIATAETGDDALLTLLATAAQRQIDAWCGRVFEAVTATRYYPEAAVAGTALRLDSELLSVTTLTNGDGTAITSGGYVLLPRNLPPYWEIRLKSAQWSFLGDDSEISVAGTWGWSATAPADIQQACRRLAGYMYRQKDSQVFDVTAQPDLGQMVLPQGMPKDVKILLQPYRKISL